MSRRIMKELYEKYKVWKHEAKRKVAQRYANFIIKQLDTAPTEQQFDFWINKGIALDSFMTEVHNIYLE